MFYMNDPPVKTTAAVKLLHPGRAKCHKCAGPLRGLRQRRLHPHGRRPRSARGPLRALLCRPPARREEGR